MRERKLKTSNIKSPPLTTVFQRLVSIIETHAHELTENLLKDL